MIKKHISLSEEDVTRLIEFKKQHGFHTDSEVFSHLLAETQNRNPPTACEIRKELEKNYLQKDRMKWATQTAEQNSIVLLDAINTILWLLNAKDNIAVEHASHPVISQSKKLLKKKLAYFKQKSDERKSKLGR